MSYQRKLLIIFSLTLTAIVILLCIDPIAQRPGYHAFADNRAFLNFPNFLNVLSNVPFLFTAFYGWFLLKKSNEDFAVIAIYAALFAGVFLTGIGSGWYHYHPDNFSLVFDRIPMTIVFTSFTCAIIYERINRKAAIRLLVPLLFTGIASVVYWYYTETMGKGDLRMYAFVQFYPMVFIALVLLLFPSPGKDNQFPALVGVLICYIIAKLCEYFDREIFDWMGVVSGHSLKHLFAAGATYYLASFFRDNEKIIEKKNIRD